jgi:hypothetical protein
MHAKPEKIRVRRLKRQLKAAVSIGVALAAGVFLACQKTVTEKVEDARSADDALGGKVNPDPPGADKSVIDVTLVDAAGTTPSIVAPPDAEALLAPLPSDAGGKADALAKRPPVVTKDGGKVDKREHRKGMPVPDNLLE